MRESGFSDSIDLVLQLALRASGIGIWEWDLETHEFFYSDRAREILGFPPDIPITLEMAIAVTHPKDFPFTFAQAKRALDPIIRDDGPYEYRAVRADTGEVRWVEADGRAVFETTDGKTVAKRYVGTIKDITDVKAHRQALEDSERSLKLALAAARMAVWDFDVASGKLTSTAELKRIFGYADSANPTVDDYRLHYLPGEYEKVQAAGQKAVENGLRHFEVEFQIKLLDGPVRWLLLRAEILFGVAAAPERVVGVVLDIDEQKRGEERQAILVLEMNHRLKNSMAVVSAVAQQTFKGEVSPASQAAFASRLKALALANDNLISGGWEGFSLFSLVNLVIAPFLQHSRHQLQLVGSDVTLPRRFNDLLALALHELATNAAKHGALSVEGGRIRVSCSRSHEVVVVTWEEKNGPPVVQSERRGFGTRLLTGLVGKSFRSFSYEFRPEGVYYEAELRIEDLPGSDGAENAN
jgi:PAS domain S-box-containing protein